MRADQENGGRDGAGAGVSKSALTAARPDGAPEGRPDNRYVTLDGLRGLAAIAVALYHYDRPLMPHGYLAVDFFFVLSGFVLLEAYRDRFAAGLGVGRFMVMRFLRLYPLFLLGSVIMIVRIGQIFLRHNLEALSLGDFLRAVPVNLLLLPSPFSNQLFPVNVPAWSLFFELLANLAMALLILRRSTARLALWVGVAGLALVSTALNLSVRAASGLADADFVLDPFSAGWGWQGLEVGLLRTAFSFALGMLIADLLRGRPRRQSLLVLPVWLAILLVLGWPVGPQLTVGFAAVVVLVVSPLLVAGASRIEPPAAWRALAMWVGDISFALYAVHVPLAGLFHRAAEVGVLPPAAMAALYLIAILVLATAAHRWFDVPVRRWLSQRLLSNKLR